MKKIIYTILILCMIRCEAQMIVNSNIFQLADEIDFQYFGDDLRSVPDEYTGKFIAILERSFIEPIRSSPPDGKAMLPSIKIVLRKRDMNGTSFVFLKLGIYANCLTDGEATYREIDEFLASFYDKSATMKE